MERRSVGVYVDILPSRGGRYGRMLQGNSISDWLVRPKGILKEPCSIKNKIPPGES